VSPAQGIGHAQVWWADLDKVRPVVILTRARVASKLTRVLVAPVTTVVRSIPTEVPIGSPEGVKDGSVANLDNIQLVPVDRMLRRAGRIAPARWRDFCAAMQSVMDC
jgi:mRNA interferase MazF